jgi:putative tryptophan/tyrosine transport system substrate-binding protein
MRRREFIRLLAAWPFAARAQQPATQGRIAIFHPAIPTTLLTETGGGSAWRAFFAELRRLGYTEGENLIIERYSAEGSGMPIWPGDRNPQTRCDRHRNQFPS